MLNLFIQETKMYYNVHGSMNITVSQEPQCARFRRISTCSPVDLLRRTQYILPGFVIVAMRHLNCVDETGLNALCYVWEFSITTIMHVLTN